MAIRRLEPHPVSQTWAASGTINLELSPKPYTITAIYVNCRTNVSTTSVTNFSDYWDRWISSMSLVGRGKTFFNFTNMRVAYHLMRFILGQASPRRPTVIAGSQTNNLQQFGYLFHFGVKPFDIGPDGQLQYNPWDLTAGIPPVETGNLTMGGAFGVAAAMGTNVTTQSGTFDVYLFGVQPEAGDPPAAYMPRAFPVWSQRTPTPTATSGAGGTQDNIPAGDFLQAMLVMTTRGTNAPRDDQTLNSMEVYNQLESRSIFKFGGQAGTSDAGGGDYKAAEILSDILSHIATAQPNEEVATPGVPALTYVSEKGLIYLPINKFATKGHPLYGADLRNVGTGDLQLRYGVANATTITMDVAYRRYQLNPAHPANQAA